MPNTEPAIQCAEDIVRYKQEIFSKLQNYSANISDASAFHIQDFMPLMTFKVYKHHGLNSITKMKNAGAIAGKLYPQGATTNAEDGVSEISEIYHVLEAMQKLNLVLCIHGENPHSFVLDREKDFLSQLQDVQKNFPRLKIVLEHITTKEAVDYVKENNNPNLAATITTHHLLYTLDAVLGGFLNPHMFCKPILKTPQDLSAIQQVVLESNNKFFLGTDSAPHKISQKECAFGCAGVFSSPVTLSLLTEFFYQHRNQWQDRQWIEKLENFCSKYGADYYELSYNTDTITLSQEDWTVPAEIAGVKPLCATQTLPWKVTKA